jgi:hypothetical protein
MPCINVREGDGLVSIIKLDQCGAPDLGAGNLLRMTTISEFGFEDTVEEGDTVNERNFGGRKCYTDVGQDEITSIAVNMTTCGINPAIDALLTGSTVYEGATVTGFGRKDLAANTNVAIQVLMRLDTDSCDGSGEAPIAGWLFPLIKNWRPAAATTLNGTDLVKPQYTGKGFKNSNIFDSSVPELAHWETLFTEADEWYGFNIFDAADIGAILPDTAGLAALDCEPVTLSGVGS